MDKYFELAKELLYNQPKLTAVQEATLLEAYSKLVDGYDYGFWGACGTGPWRATVLAEMLKRNPDIRVYNPDKGPEAWREYHNFEEEIVRRFVTADFFHIGPETRATVSLLEAAAHAFFRPAFFHIEFIEPGTEIRGQIVSDYQAHILNQMRTMVEMVALNCSLVFHSLEQAGRLMPVDLVSLENLPRSRGGVDPDDQQRVRHALYHTPYGEWVKQNVISISDDPLDAQLEILAALVVAFSRLPEAGALFIQLPDISTWHGRESHGEIVEGRLYDDLYRTVQPYLHRLVKFAPVKVYLR